MNDLIDSAFGINIIDNYRCLIRLIISFAHHTRQCLIISTWGPMLFSEDYRASYTKVNTFTKATDSRYNVLPSLQRFKCNASTFFWTKFSGNARYFKTFSNHTRMLTIPREHYTSSRCISDTINNCLYLAFPASNLTKTM